MLSKESYHKINMQKIFLIFTLLTFPVTNAFSDDLKLPFKDKGACPFECCQYTKWKVIKSTKLRSEPSSSAKFIYILKKGDQVTALTGDVFTIKAGEVEILKSMNLTLYPQQDESDRIAVEKQFKPGEILKSLHYEGEGYCAYWIDGQNVNLDIDCLNPGKMFPEPVSYKVLSEPLAEWWIKIQTKDGVVGWTDEASNFDGNDSCG